MIRLVSVLGAAALLGGCALLASPDPVQLYRFGDAAPRAGAASNTALTAVSMRRITFPEAAAGDRLLAINGTEAFYIAGARWVSPAESLFTEAIENAFAGQSRRVRLIGRQELTPANLILDLDMRAFEARYDAGPDAPPTIRVAARARMLRFPERTVIAEQTFSVEQPAGENRISAIVAAFDAATADVGGQLVAWTDNLAG